MDHVVYLDKKARELDNVLNGKKTMIIRGATGRKMPYGRVNKADMLYFIENSGDGMVKAKATVKQVIQSDKMTTDESVTMVDDYQPKLMLTDAQKKRWAGKRYLVLVEISDVINIDPFKIDKTDFSNMDDWLCVETIEKVK